MSLSTSLNSVEKLQSSLQAKAKSEPSYRFYSLWDKICREDVLREAYRRSRANAGAPGVDGIDFKAIETNGVERWLKALQEELRGKSYAPQPLLRVWIPKRNGGQRPLSIPVVKDRVVQTAVVLVLGSILEADLAPQQYGFRPKLDAKMGIWRYDACTFTSHNMADGKWWTRTYPITSQQSRMVRCYVVSADESPMDSFYR